VVKSGHVELSTKARQDLRRLARGPDRKPILDALAVSLVAIPPPDNLDVNCWKVTRRGCGCGCGWAFTESSTVR
jgi:hypothetical protein